MCRYLKRDGRRYLFTEDARRDREFLFDLCRHRRFQHEIGLMPESLLAARQQFREIARSGRVVGLFACIDSDEPELVRLAIWLFGRLRVSPAILEVAPYRFSPDVRIRREAARALNRLHAWAELRSIAEDADARVRQYARQEPAAPFTTRLSRVASGCSASEMPRTRQRFFERLPLGPGRAAKPPEFIRELLQRIRRLVRG